MAGRERGDMPDRYASSAELEPHPRALWFGVLAGPLGWLAHLLASYGIAALACARGWPGFTLAGLSVAQTLMVGLTLAIEVVIGSAAWSAYTHWRRYQQAGERGRNRTHFTRWMAKAGMLVSGMFFIAVLFGGIPDILVRACR